MTRGPWCYEYPRPAVTVDIVLLQRSRRSVLLIQRKDDPFQGSWALPGGFLDEDEDLHEAAVRELREETAIEFAELSQFRAYGTPGRDPRGHTVSIVFVAETDGADAIAGDDAADARWWDLDDLPELAFDHAEILSDVEESILE